MNLHCLNCVNIRSEVMLRPTSATLRFVCFPTKEHRAFLDWEPAVPNCLVTRTDNLVEINEPNTTGKGQG